LGSSATPTSSTAPLSAADAAAAADEEPLAIGLENKEEESNRAVADGENCSGCVRLSDDEGLLRDAATSGEWRPAALAEKRTLFASGCPLKRCWSN